MITEEEKEDIINKAVEKALLALPEVVGNMMSQHALLNKVNSKFYSDYPEFAGHKDIVASVVEMTEGKNPLDDYEDLLKNAIPEIRKRIALTESLDIKSIPDKPNRDFSSINGVI